MGAVGAGLASGRVSLAVHQYENGDGVSVARAGSGRLLCSADGPFAIDEGEDYVPDSVRSTLLSVGWTVQISAPHDLSKTDFEIVERFARRVVDDARGVLYDPQEDRVTWPRNVKKLRSVQAAPGQDLGTLDLEFVFARYITHDDGELLLEVLRRGMPEALPRRFGDFEPMQGRLERDGDPAFTVMLDGRSMLFWAGTKPFDHGYATSQRGLGSALTPEQRDARTPIIAGRKAITTDGITLKFRSEVTSDPAWLSAIERTFKELSRALRPFIAAAYIDPPGSRGNLLSAQYWLGLSPDPRWLLWVANPYLQLLPDHLPTTAERTDEHLFIRSGESPLDEPGLEANQIGWAPELVRKGTQKDIDLAAAVIPNFR